MMTNIPVLQPSQHDHNIPRLAAMVKGKGRADVEEDKAVDDRHGKKTRFMKPMVPDGDDDDNDDAEVGMPADDDDEDVDVKGQTRKRGPWSGALIEECRAFGAEVRREAEALAIVKGKDTYSIMCHAGLTMTPARGKNIANDYRRWFSLKFPKAESGMLCLIYRLLVYSRWGQHC